MEELLNNKETKIGRSRSATVDLRPEESRASGYACVISGMLAQGTIGIVQLWGNIAIYITSYLKSYDSSITLADTYPVFAISILVGAVFM
jgi:hypothetical protein